MELFVLTLEKTKEFVKTNCSLKANFIVSTTKKNFSLGRIHRRVPVKERMKWLKQVKKKVVSWRAHRKLDSCITFWVKWCTQNHLINLICWIFTSFFVTIHFPWKWDAAAKEFPIRKFNYNSEKKKKQKKKICSPTFASSFCIHQNSWYDDDMSVLLLWQS